MRVNYETSVKVRGLCLRFLNNMGSGLVVGLGSGSIYRIIQIYVPYLPSGECRVTIGVGDNNSQNKPALFPPTTGEMCVG